MGDTGGWDGGAGTSIEWCDIGWRCGSSIAPHIPPAVADGSRSHDAPATWIATPNDGCQVGIIAILLKKILTNHSLVHLIIHFIFLITNTAIHPLYCTCIHIFLWQVLGVAFHSSRPWLPTSKSCLLQHLQDPLTLRGGAGGWRGRCQLYVRESWPGQCYRMCGKTIIFTNYMKE